MSAAPDRAQAREWLEAQIAELSTLRNATPRDSGFKQWRQHTLTLIQRIWVGDPSRPSRFKRIPFTAAGPRPDREQVRAAFSRGCVEAMVCLRALLKEVAGEGAVESAGADEPHANERGDRLPAAGGSPAALRQDGGGGRAASTPAADPPGPAESAAEHEAVHRAMTDFLSSSPVFAAMSRISRDRDGAARLSPAALAMAAVASELGALGVPDASRPRLEAALETLVQHAGPRSLTWEELRRALTTVMEHRAVARRVLPLVLPLLDEAA